MKNPRIYLYKITFEEVPYFYYGIHREKEYNEYYMGSPVTNKWVWNIYTPKKQILQEFESIEDASKVEIRIIKYFLNKDSNCLNANAGGIFLYTSGRENHCYGKSWWNDGTKNKRQTECPGTGWVKGKLYKKDGYKRGQNSHLYGKKWWNNGTEEILSNKCPEGWIKGRVKKDYFYRNRPVLSGEHKKKLSIALKGKFAGERNPSYGGLSEEHKRKIGKNNIGRKWWNNGIENKFQATKPGNEWIKGIYRGK
jgi:hypothetical protein